MRQRNVHAPVCMKVDVAPVRVSRAEHLGRSPGLQVSVRTSNVDGIQRQQPIAQACPQWSRTRQLNTLQLHVEVVDLRRSTQPHWSLQWPAHGDYATNRRLRLQCRRRTEQIDSLANVHTSKRKTRLGVVVAGQLRLSGDINL